VVDIWFVMPLVRHDISLREDIISFANIDFGIIALWRVVVLCLKTPFSAI